MRAHLALSLSFSLALFASCVQPISIEETESNGGESIGEPEVDMTALLTESVTLLRVLPVDTSTNAEIFCVAVPVTQRVLITSASCFSTGIRYGEVLSGPEVDFSQSGPRLAIIEKVYSHPMYVPNIPANGGFDLAVVHVDRDVNMTPLTPYGGDLDPSITPLLRVGYLPNEALLFRKQVAFAANFTQSMSVLSFNMSAGQATPCQVTGSPVLSTISGKPTLIAVSSFGDVSCTDGGSASLFKQSIDFLNPAIGGTLALPEGVNAQVQGDLSCSQAFKCNDVSACLAFVGEEARIQYSALFQCTQNTGCDNFACYMTDCPEEYSACFNQ